VPEIEMKYARCAISSCVTDLRLIVVVADVADLGIDVLRTGVVREPPDDDRLLRFFRELLVLAFLAMVKAPSFRCGRLVIFL
jgi:hypothetical protein